MFLRSIGHTSLLVDSNSEVVGIVELEEMWKEATVNYFNALS
jgi:high-affinity K+ transport system ATPase subunit B